MSKTKSVSSKNLMEKKEKQEKMNYDYKEIRFF